MEQLLEVEVDRERESSRSSAGKNDQSVINPSWPISIPCELKFSSPNSTYSFFLLFQIRITISELEWELEFGFYLGSTLSTSISGGCCCCCCRSSIQAAAVGEWIKWAPSTTAEIAKTSLFRYNPLQIEIVNQSNGIELNWIGSDEIGLDRKAASLDRKVWSNLVTRFSSCYCLNDRNFVTCLTWLHLL